VHSYLKALPVIVGDTILPEHLAIETSPLILDLAAQTFIPKYALCVMFRLILVRLATDMKQKLRFRCSSTETRDVKAQRRRLILSNVQPAPLTFTLATAAPFFIAETKSSSLPHALASVDMLNLQSTLDRSVQTSTLKGKRPATLLFALQPSDSVEVFIEFVPSFPLRETYHENLVITFATGHVQVLPVC